jgi:hypothetical protein
MKSSLRVLFVKLAYWWSILLRLRSRFLAHARAQAKFAETTKYSIAMHFELKEAPAQVWC